MEFVNSAKRGRQEFQTTSKRPCLDVGSSGILTIPSASTPPYDSFQHIIAVVKSGSDPGDFKWPRGVAIQENNRHICVTDSFHHRVLFFSEKGIYMSQFGDQYLLRPCGILIHKNYIYVTDRSLHAIFQFSLAGLAMIKQFGKEGSAREEFNSPHQLAVSPNQLLYIADRGNNRVQILNNSLFYKGSLQHQSMTHPVDIKFSNNQMLVLSCWDNPCMHIFTLAGEKIGSIITRGDGMQIRRAYFFCLDAQCNIVISDSTGDVIKVFSLDGDLIYCVGERGYQPGMFHCPSGIAILNQSKLVCVSENCNYELQIFSP